ncbi:hypothetical protein AAW50_03500 [Mycoplasmopsis canis]|uniref:hypothetical protein n=1 Tax=Mycoplasmopsis canis TaxID=29555 RepID=UPI0006248E46|nr:hypothetical protein [Mycoplasmopsis canis]AKF41031.1 hypothetical protein AAW50_01075 [Mycoplasmopsis canis]AKF41454.1 hypothetical protein AAW50_03500 [Mycoplasmopsis canis]
MENQKGFNPLAIVSGEILITEIKDIKSTVSGKTFLTAKTKISNSIYEPEKNLNVTLLFFNDEHIKFLQAHDKSKFISIFGNYSFTKYSNFDEISQRNKENLNVTINVVKIADSIKNQEYLHFNIAGFIASDVSKTRLSDGTKQLDKYAFRLALDDSQKNTHFLYVNLFNNINSKPLNIKKGAYIWGRAKARGTFNESKKDGTLHYSISFDMNELLFAEQKLEVRNNNLNIMNNIHEMKLPEPEPTQNENTTITEETIESLFGDVF